MTLMQRGTAWQLRRFLFMEKLDTSVTLHRLAAKMRLQALQTDQTAYRQLMLRAAATFEDEADRLFADRFNALLYDAEPHFH